MQRGASVIRGGLASAGFRGSPARTTRSFIRGGSSRSHIAAVMMAAVSETTGEAMPAETEKEWTKRDLRHTSAVVICPPTSTWEPIQRIRAVNDKSYTRWMPHFNLLYPFLLDDGEDEGNFDRAAAKAREALRDIEPFTVSLRSFGHFAHAKSCTVWLHPSGHGAEDMEDEDSNGSPEASGGFRNSADSLPPVSDGVMATQAALERAFPFANDLSTISPAGFTPHLSVGQYDDKETASEALETMNATWAPMTFEVDAVYIISRAGPDAPFEFKARVPLGASAGGAWRRGDGGDAETDWWTEAYSPPPPPEGARCLRPKPKRKWRGKKRGGGRGGRGRGDPGA